MTKIIFKRSNDALNVVDKKFQVVMELDIHLKNNFDIKNPIIVLSGIDLTGVNYFEIPELKRSYHIRGVVSFGNVFTQVMAATDLLETYKEVLLKSNASFFRKITSGDYFNGSVDYSVLTDVVNYGSDVQLDIENSLVLSTIGNGVRK